MGETGDTGGTGGFLEGFGPARADFARRAFDSLLLPLPGPGEFTRTDDGGRLVLIDPAGCVLRLIFRGAIGVFSKGAERHDRILQPLGRQEENGVIIDINPGILVPAVKKVRLYSDPDWLRQTHENLQSIGYDLTADGYDWQDRLNPYNAGYIPGTQTPEEPRGFAVVLDPGRMRIDAYACARDLKAAGQIAAMLALREKAKREDFYKNNPTPVQDKMYGDLKRSFAAAAGGPAGMENFWKDCTRAKREGRLVCDWRDVAYEEDHEDMIKIRNMPRMADAYAARLDRSAPFAGPP